MADTTKATGLINFLSKARKNIRLYPAHHPMYEKTIDDFCRRISSVLGGDTIRMRINQYDILFNDEVIYHNRDRDESLALFFFKDGLRELSFLKGITRDEVMDFLKIISLDFENSILNDDIVTLLWEMDFQYIKYLVDDASLQDEAFERESVGQARGAAAGEKAIIEAYENALHSESSSKVSILPLTNDDIQRIVEAIENDPPDKTGMLVRMLFEMQFLAEKKDEYEVVNRCIRQTLDYAMTRADMELVNYVMKNIQRASLSAPTEQSRELLINIERYMHSAAFIRLFGKAIEAGEKISGEALQEFASILNTKAIPHLIMIIGELNNISARRTVINVLSLLGARDLALLSKGLNDKKWYVVRNIIYILRKIGNESASAYLSKSAEHPDKRVRKEAVHALGELGGEAALAILKERMNDEADSVRVASVIAIGSIKIPLSKKMIIGHIESKNFRDKNSAEKKEIFKVLAQWKEMDVIAFLVKVIKKRFLFHRVKKRETRAAAIQCLGMIGAEKVRNIAGQFSDSDNRLIGEQALEILREKR